MARRLFLVELDQSEFSRDLAIAGVKSPDEFKVIETFIPGAEGKLTQLLSSSRKLLTAKDKVDLRWSKAEFQITSSGWKLEKKSPRIDIASEEYYSLLIGPNAAVEEKERTVFHLNGRRYSLELNIERNYAVIQIDYEGDYSIAYDQFFTGLPSISVVGELFMSLEETFCRLYLKHPRGFEKTS